ncbi:hypothetical protein [Methylobacterium nigriterrae]|uniref:phosphorylase family protein n=1 Tax=Methylobacterium nigriterrae TaxID=3127512 RepID=UPI003013B1E9
MTANLRHNKFCLLCAKTEELRQVIKIFDEKFDRVRGHLYTDHVYRLSEDATIRVATCSAMGHMSAAVRTGQLITLSQPAIMIFLGTAASLKPHEVQIGDVVIPRKAISRVYEKISEAGQRDFEERAAAGDFQEFILQSNALISDLATVDCSEDALTVIAALEIDGIALERGSGEAIALGGKSYALRQPKVHDDIDIFSCGMVVDSISYREFITTNTHRNLRKAAIIDMESYGFFKAIDATRGSGVGSSCSGLMIRGISDYAGRKAETEGRPEGWKKAVRNAAIVAAALLQRIVEYEADHAAV